MNILHWMAYSWHYTTAAEAICPDIHYHELSFGSVVVAPEGCPNGLWCVPVYRFYEFRQGIHFYAANQTEATTVNNYHYQTYRYEATAGYVVINRDY